MIICAALLIKNTDAVIGCVRHGFGYSALRELNLNIKASEIEEGFLTDKNVFLNRADAFHHAIASGQLSATTIHYKKQNKEIELYSEDLY